MSRVLRQVIPIISELGSEHLELYPIRFVIGCIIKNTQTISTSAIASKHEFFRWILVRIP